MALRFLLITFVAGLGLEIPSGPDLGALGQTGREWASARLVELSGLRAEAGRALARVVDCERDAEPAVASVVGRDLATADLAFEAATEGTAAEFSADLARASEPPPAVEAVALVAELDGPAALPSGEEMATSTPAEAAPEPSRVARLSSAVRLTREAAHAWTILIRPTEAVATR